MREIVLDTETTGVEANNGDRIVEIGCVELVNHCPSGRSFHCYINPERPMSEGAAVAISVGRTTFSLTLSARWMLRECSSQ